MMNTRFLLLLLALSSFLSSSMCAFGQGNIVTPKTVLSVVNGQTRPVANATITVCGPNAAGIPCSPVLVGTLFKDAALTQPLSNPFTADSNGNYQFAVANGQYTVTETAAGFVGYSYQFSLGGGGGSGATVSGTPNQINVSAFNVASLANPLTFPGPVNVNANLNVSAPISLNPPALPFVALDCDNFGAYQSFGLAQFSVVQTAAGCVPMYNPDGSANQQFFTVDPLGYANATNGQYYAFNSTAGKFQLTTPGQVTSGTGTTNSGCIDVRNYLVVPFNPYPETEDIGLAIQKALNAVIAPSNPLGTYCVDASMLVPSFSGPTGTGGQQAYGNRLFANTNPWFNFAANKNPDIHMPNSPISTSVQWTTPQGAMLVQGVPSAGTVDIGNSYGMLGSILSACNDSGGCGPNAYPQFTTAAQCLSGSTNCYPVGGPWASGANAQPAAYNMGQIQVQTNANTAQCGSPANSGQSNHILCGASGTPTFTAAMVGGIVAYNCTSNTCTEGSTSAYSLSRITKFIAHGAAFPIGGGTCTEVSGTGGCLLVEGIVQGGTNLTAAYLLYAPNLPVIVCDGCSGNAINNFTFGHAWRDFAIDVNGVSGALGYLGPSVQERTEFTDFLIQLQGQQILNNAATSGCASFGGAPTTTVVATHWSTAGVMGCSSNTNATSNVAGGTYGEVIEGHNQIKGTDNGCPNVHNFGTIVGQAASKFYDAAWVDGCTNTGVFFGPHAEYYSNDNIDVGALHPVTGVLFFHPDAANMSGANAVVELHTGTASNVVFSVGCLFGVAPVKDDNLTTPETEHCGATTATQTMTRYFQPGSAGGNSFPVSYAVTPLKLTGLNADQALTTIYTTAASGSMGGAGTYRICYSAYTTTSGSGTTSTVQTSSNNGNGGSQVFTSATWALNSLSVTGQVNGCQIVHAAVSSALKVGTTGGTYGTSAYSLEATVEQLQGTP